MGNLHLSQVQQNRNTNYSPNVKRMIFLCPRREAYQNRTVRESVRPSVRVTCKVVSLKTLKLYDLESSNLRGMLLGV